MHPIFYEIAPRDQQLYLESGPLPVLHKKGVPMKKTPAVVAIALGLVLVLCFMVRKPFSPNIPSDQQIEAADDTVGTDIHPGSPQDDYSPSSAEQVEAIEEAPEPSKGRDGPDHRMQAETVEQVLEGGEEKTEAAPVSDINLTEDLSNDNRIQKVAEIRLVRCEDKSCVVTAQVKPGEEEEVQMAFILFQKDHLQYGSGFKIDSDKDDAHTVTFTYTRE